MAGEFSVPCECGATLPVTAAEAGGALPCRCGRSVRVPRLSELRRAKGLDGCESGVRDTIARMIREGTLPWGTCCAATGAPTDDVLLFDVLCERAYKKGSGLSKAGIVLIVLSFFVCFPVALMMWIFAWDFLKSPVEQLGRDAAVKVPLRVDRSAHDEVRAASPYRLRQLLCTVPIYEQLFREFPEAVPSVR